MNNNQEILLMELFEKGIDSDISTKAGKITIELTNRQDNTIIGVAKDETLEKALSTIIKRLVDDSKRLKETSNVLPFEGLTKL